MMPDSGGKDSHGSRSGGRLSHGSFSQSPYIEAMGFLNFDIWFFFFFFEDLILK